jgi:hypothetical protein
MMLPSATSRASASAFRRVATLLTAVLIAGCSNGAQPSGSSPAAPSLPGCVSGNPVDNHQSPEIESALPASVADRQLARWSVRGRCWLALTVGEANVDKVVAGFEGPAGSPPIDIEHLGYGVAGRSDTKNDPPYFVFAATRADDEREISLAVYLLLGSGQFRDPVGDSDLGRYTAKTIAGRQVHVGTESMLKQGDHQRGWPTLYQTEHLLFLIVTDDEKWASDAIGQLPLQ